MRFRAGLHLACLIVLSAAPALCGESLVISDLSYPELTDRESILVKGRVAGLDFEQRHPIAEQPGDYRLTIKAQDLAGRTAEREILVKKVASLPRAAQRMHRDPSQKRSDAGASRVHGGLESPGPTDADNALILSISDGLGHRSAQMLRPRKDLFSAQAWAGRVRQVWIIFYDRATGFFRGIGISLKRTWRPEPAAGPAPRSPAPVNAPRALVGIERTAVGAGASRTQRPASAPAAPAAAKAAADAPDEPAPHGGSEAEESDPSMIETRVRFPDERGGITITVDNFRTGKRTVVTKDPSGREVERQVVDIPDDKLKGKRTPDPEDDQSDTQI